MAGFGAPLAADQETLDEVGPSLPVSWESALGNQFWNAAESMEGPRLLAKAASWAQPYSGGLIQGSPPPTISAEEANARYGGAGLRWNRPITDDDAAFQAAQWQKGLVQAQLDAASNANPLASWGAALAGGLFDPVNMGLMVATGGVGEEAVAGIGMGARALGFIGRESAEAGADTAVQAAQKFQTLRRIANTIPGAVTGGLIENAPFAGYGELTSHYVEGRDWDLGEGLAAMAGGALLHTAWATSLRALGSIARLRTGVAGGDVSAGLAEPEPGLAAPEAPGGPGGGVEAPGLTPPSGWQAEEPDLHALARQIDPETFAEYDALGAEGAQHRASLAALGAARATSDAAVKAQGDIDTILGRVNGVEARLTKTAAGRLADARARLYEAQNAETPEMAAVRGKLQATDIGRRKLAEPVSAAYRAAREIGPRRAPPIEEQFEPNPVPPGGVPAEVEALTPDSRAAAWMRALERSRDDEAIDSGKYVDREVNPPSQGALDEASAESRIEGFRPLGEDVAMTAHGRSVPVRYGLAEADSLLASHTDQMTRDPSYPPELQPSAVDAPGALAESIEGERGLQPDALIDERATARGAPIVSPDGVVEAGNRALVALRRSALAGTQAYQRYLARLRALGFPVDGMNRPVLVRMRTEPLPGGARAMLAREMNIEGGGGRAMGDAGLLDPQTVEALASEDPDVRGPAERGFLARLTGLAGQLADVGGRITAAARERIDAALMMKAYGDRRLVEAVFGKDVDPAMRAIGRGLRGAALDWARLRVALDEGRVAPTMDLAPALRSALDMREGLPGAAKAADMTVGELLGTKEQPVLSGSAVGVSSEAFLRTLFRDEAFTQARGAGKIEAVFKRYAQDALATAGQVGVGDANSSTQIYANAFDRFAEGPKGVDVRPPGKAVGPAGGDVRDAGLGAPREPGVGGGEPAGPGGGEAERAGGAGGMERGAAAEPAAGAGERGDGAAAVDRAAAGRGGADAVGAKPAVKTHQTGDELLMADPEMKAAHTETARLAAEHGIALDTLPSEDPNNIAEAVHAISVCLTGEL